jgi:hypothetical protein
MRVVNIQRSAVQQIFFSFSILTTFEKKWVRLKKPDPRITSSHTFGPSELKHAVKFLS